MNKADYYKNLDLAEIRIIAHNWGRKHPTIKKISLFRAFRPQNKYIISVESFNLTELNQIAESLPYKSFEIYVKESPYYLPFFFQAVKAFKPPENVAYGDLDENVPVEFQKDFFKYAKDKFESDLRTSLTPEFKRDLNEAYTTSKKNLTPIWIFHLKIPEQELPDGIFQDSSELIYERKNGPIPNLLAKMGHDQKNKKNIFPCPLGTKWDEVKITLIENDVVSIETPSGRGRYSYHELGMADGRRRDKLPGMLWELLKQFAKNQGVISRKNSKYHRRLPDTAKRLNKHLQEIFKIADSIFKDHYKIEKGYKTKIFFSDRTIAS